MKGFLGCGIKGEGVKVIMWVRKVVDKDEGVISMKGYLGCGFKGEGVKVRSYGLG